MGGKPAKLLKVESCKLCNDKYMMTSTPIPNPENFAFIADLQSWS